MTSSASTAYLAFDLGASTSRAILGILRDRSLELTELHRFSTPILERDDHLFWDLDTIWSELKIGLEKALAAAPALKSISVDSWGIDYVQLDSLGRSIADAYCYRDPRTTGVMESAFRISSAKEIYSTTGIQFLPFNTLYQLMAEKEDETGPAGVLNLPIADYFNYRFSGAAKIEVSMASTTQMMDVHEKQWSMALLSKFGLDPAQWPEIVPSGSVLGRAILHPKIKVVATCSHDTGCAVAATPAGAQNQDPGQSWAFISCGTWSCMGDERRAPLLTDAAREAGFTNEAGLDGTIRFLKNLTGLWVLQECMREWRQTDDLEWSDLEDEAYAVLAQIEEQSRSAPTSALAPTTIDLEDRRFLSRGPMVERLQAYCRESNLDVPDSRGAIVLSILGSIAHSYAKTLIELERVTGATYGRIYLVGGGSRNSLLCQLTSSALNCEVVAGPTEATAIGNLLIQARSMGDLPEGMEIRDIVANSSDLRVYSPDPE